VTECNPDGVAERRVPAVRGLAARGRSAGGACRSLRRAARSRVAVASLLRAGHVPPPRARRRGMGKGAPLARLPAGTYCQTKQKPQPRFPTP